MAQTRAWQDKLGQGTARQGRQCRVLVTAAVAVQGMAGSGGAVAQGIGGWGLGYWRLGA